MEHETIAAISTARGASGIGIVKISGPRAVIIAKRLFFPGKHAADRTTPDDWEIIPKRMNYGWIRSAENRQPIDEVLLCVMPGPRSYTGEDVVEINGHGGAHCMAMILEEVIGCGARTAEPGEFTRRAWLNGRISLSEAEAVIEMIQARSRTALRAAAKRLEGELGRKLLKIRNTLSDLMAELEAEIEFGEGEGQYRPTEAIVQTLRAEIQWVLGQMIDEYQRQRGYTEGIRVTVVGRPNVGKSSLVNRLYKRERVLVSSKPGTTRDLVDIEMRLGQLYLILTDTAGLHPSSDEIEILSMEKTRKNINQSELILFILDVSEEITEEDESIRSLINETPVILVFNKTDLLCGKPVKRVPEEWPKWPRVYISAKQDQEFKKLESAIVKRLEIEIEDKEEEIVPNLRQSQSLQKAQAAVARSIAALEMGPGEEVLAIDDLKEAALQIDLAIGRKADKDVMDIIFSKFCIGK